MNKEWSELSKHMQEKLRKEQTYIPNTDTLKLLSKEFDVSINTLLGDSYHFWYGSLLSCIVFRFMAGVYTIHMY